MKKLLVYFILCFFVISCKERESSVAIMESVFYTDSIISLKMDSVMVEDTAYLSDIVEDIKYINLDISNTEHFFQLQYTDSFIVANNSDSLFLFNHKGRKTKSIPLHFGCFDVSEQQDSIYTYTFQNKRLSCYDFKGNQIWTHRLHYKDKEVGSYGYYFAQINDSLFAIAIQNQGFNPDQLIVVNKCGYVKKQVSNKETFPYPGVRYTAHTDWYRTLTINDGQVLYHPVYGDTVYTIGGDMQLIPYLVEEIVKKVPLEDRPEYTGNNWKQFDAVCMKNMIYVTRIFNTLRYAIVEYKIGSINQHMSNYWVYDKKERTLKKTFNNISESLKKGIAHFGIFNDYDGGLAFAPDFNSNEYLIMVNAGKLQGNKTVYAKQIYLSNLPTMKNKYNYRSDIFQDSIMKRKADAFWFNCDEKKLTLTVVKLKK